MGNKNLPWRQFAALPRLKTMLAASLHPLPGCPCRNGGGSRVGRWQMILDETHPFGARNGLAPCHLRHSRETCWLPHRMGGDCEGLLVRRLTYLQITKEEDGVGGRHPAGGEEFTSYGVTQASPTAVENSCTLPSNDKVRGQPRMVRKGGQGFTS